MQSTKPNSSSIMEMFVKLSEEGNFKEVERLYGKDSMAAANKLYERKQRSSQPYLGTKSTSQSKTIKPMPISSNQPTSNAAVNKVAFNDQSKNSNFTHGKDPNTFQKTIDIHAQIEAKYSKPTSYNPSATLSRPKGSSFSNESSIKIGKNEPPLELARKAKEVTTEPNTEEILKKSEAELANLPDSIPDSFLLIKILETAFQIQNQSMKQQ